MCAYVCVCKDPELKSTLQKVDPDVIDIALVRSSFRKLWQLLFGVTETGNPAQQLSNDLVGIVNRHESRLVTRNSRDLAIIFGQVPKLASSC